MCRACPCVVRGARAPQDSFHNSQTQQLDTLLRHRLAISRGTPARGQKSRLAGRRRCCRARCWPSSPPTSWRAAWRPSASRRGPAPSRPRAPNPDCEDVRAGSRVAVDSGARERRMQGDEREPGAVGPREAGRTGAPAASTLAPCAHAAPVTLRVPRVARRPGVRWRPPPGGCDSARVRPRRWRAAWDALRQCLPWLNLLCGTRVGVACAPAQVVRDLERAPETVNLRDEAYVKRAAGRLPDIGRKVGRSPPSALPSGAPAGALLRRSRPGRRAAALPGLDSHAASARCAGCGRRPGRRGSEPCRCARRWSTCRHRQTWGPAAGPMARPTDRVWNPAAPRAGGVPAEHGQPGHRQRLQH